MLERLLKDLNSSYYSVRTAALQEARSLPPEQLLQLFERQAVFCRLRRHRIELLSLIFALLMIAWFLAQILVDFHWLSDIMKAIHCLLFFTGAIFYTAQKIYIFNGPARAVRELLTLMEGMEDVSFLVPLLEFCYGERQPISSTLSNMILRLLPQLRARQVNTWTTEQKQTLLLPLTRPVADEKITVSVLKALEQVGDASAIPAVQKLAVMHVSDFGNKAHGAYRVQQAARDCLPFLKVRVEQEEQAKILLRASDAATDAGPDVLLRPAAQNTDTIISEQLLRPTTNQE